MTAVFRIIYVFLFLYNFRPDNGAFFINYVITSALVGTALEYMRFSELFMYAMRLSFARSVAEIPAVRAANVYEFPFGFNYGWMLLIFALTVAYGVVCPLITPFGLFYLVMDLCAGNLQELIAEKGAFPPGYDKDAGASGSSGARSEAIASSTCRGGRRGLCFLGGRKNWLRERDTSTVVEVSSMVRFLGGRRAD